MGDGDTGVLAIQAGQGAEMVRDLRKEEAEKLVEVIAGGSKIKEGEKEPDAPEPFEFID